MNWNDEIEREMARGKEAERTGNRGKARTSARRAAGMAISALQERHPERRYGRDFIAQLRSFAADVSLPQHVRDAADRLQTRLSPQFDSPSTQPIVDAGIIIEYVIKLMS
jgi:HEPN domain-containing protein